MKRRNRLPDNMMRGIEDIIAECQHAGRTWQRALERAERQGDVVTVIALARIRDSLAEIERLARDARQNRYNGDEP